MPKSNYIYTDPTLGTNDAEGNTPYGIYDGDLSFVSESVDVASPKKIPWVRWWGGGQNLLLCPPPPHEDDPSGFVLQA